MRRARAEGPVLPKTIPWPTHGARGAAGGKVEGVRDGLLLAQEVEKGQVRTRSRARALIRTAKAEDEWRWLARLRPLAQEEEVLLPYL